MNVGRISSFYFFMVFSARFNRFVIRKRCGSEWFAVINVCIRPHSRDYWAIVSVNCDWFRWCRFIDFFELRRRINWVIACWPIMSAATLIWSKSSLRRRNSDRRKVNKKEQKKSGSDPAIASIVAQLLEHRMCSGYELCKSLWKFLHTTGESFPSDLQFWELSSISHGNLGRTCKQNESWLTDKEC